MVLPVCETVTTMLQPIVNLSVSSYGEWRISECFNGVRGDSIKCHVPIPLLSSSYVRVVLFTSVMTVMDVLSHTCTYLTFRLTLVKTYICI